jgi:hypothetical protein
MRGLGRSEAAPPGDTDDEPARLLQSPARAHYLLLVAGASLAAMAHLLKIKGYRLIGANGVLMRFQVTLAFFFRTSLH